MDNTFLNVIFNLLGFRYLLNLTTVFILFRFIYYKNYKKNDLFLTFFGFNSIIFFISYMLIKVEISLFCFVIILLTFLLENSFWGKKEASKIIIYDSIDCINQSQQFELIEDLKSKTGIEIHRISIDNIDYLKDSCAITIYYYEN